MGTAYGRADKEGNDRSGQILARPKSPERPWSGGPGLHPLGLDRRDAWLYVPRGIDPKQPVPFVLGFHGAGGQGRNHVGHMQALADERGVLVLAPTSRQQTWDMLYRQYGPDIEFIDRSLEKVFDRFTIDCRRIGVEGFSDGASYALSVGVTNGDLFTHVLAFSPGFMAPAAQRGLPAIFVSHGTNDTVLPIDRCSRRMVPRLVDAGYPVEFIEFEGGHTVPETIAEQGFDWFLAGEV